MVRTRVSPILSFGVILSPSSPPLLLLFERCGWGKRKDPPPSQAGVSARSNHSGHSPESPVPVGAPAASVASATGIIPVVETDLAALAATSVPAALVVGPVAVPIAASAFSGDVLLNLVHHRIQKSILFVSNATQEYKWSYFENQHQGGPTVPCTRHSFLLAPYF